MDVQRWLREQAVEEGCIKAPFNPSFLAVILIDFAQVVDPQQNPAVFPLLVRDIERVCRYFARYGVVADAVDLAKDMWTRYQGVLE